MIKAGDLVTGAYERKWRGIVTSVNNSDVFVYVFSHAHWTRASSGNRNIIMWEHQLALVDR